MASKGPRMFLQGTIPGPKFHNDTKFRSHALRQQIPLEHRVSISDAYRLKRLAQWEARRTEQRTIDNMNRRGIGSAQPNRPIPPYVKLIVRPGARILSERGHVDTTSETFRMARKRTKDLKTRMAKDEEAAQVLYNVRDLVNQKLLNLAMSASYGVAHANFLNEFAQYLLESLPYFQWLQRRQDPPAPKFRDFEQKLGWDWEKMVGSFANALDMHHNNPQDTKDSVISACVKFSNFAGRIGLAFVFADPSPELMEDIQHEVEMEDISPDTHNPAGSVTSSADSQERASPSQTVRSTQATQAASPAVALQVSRETSYDITKTAQPQLGSAGGPEPTSISTQSDPGRPQSAAEGPSVPAVSGLQAIWVRKKAEAAAARSIVEKQAAATREASFSLRKPPAVPEEDKKDTKSDKDSEDVSDDYVDCKGNQMRTPESLRSLQKLLKEFSRRDFQKLLAYEFTDENIGFMIDELYTAGEAADKDSVACIVLACQYVVCSRRRKIARASQMLQQQPFRDFQVNLRRLRQRLEKKEKTPEFCGDEVLVGLLADVRKAEGILQEDGQVAWTI